MDNSNYNKRLQQPSDNDPFNNPNHSMLDGHPIPSPSSMKAAHNGHGSHHHHHHQKHQQQPRHRRTSTTTSTITSSGNSSSSTPNAMHIAAATSTPSTSSATTTPPTPGSPLAIDEQAYVRGLINRWRSNSIDFIEMIGELLNILPEEDQIQFMSGIIDLMYKKRNNPEEENRVRQYLMGSEM